MPKKIITVFSERVTAFSCSSLKGKSLSDAIFTSNSAEMENEEFKIIVILQ
jgi:hypothetical protein